MKITSTDQLAVVINTLVAMYNYQVAKIEDEKSLVFGIKESETEKEFYIKATWITAERFLPVNDISDGNSPASRSAQIHILDKNAKDQFERLYDFIESTLKIVSESEIEVIR